MKYERLPVSKADLTNTHEDTLGYGKAEGKELERSIRKTDGAVPISNFSTQREKSQVGNAICLLSLKGFLLGAASGVNNGSSHSHTVRERVSALPWLCLEGEPTPPRALSLAA